MTHWAAFGHSIGAALRLVGFTDRQPRIAGEDELRPLVDAAVAGDAVATRPLLTALGPHLLRTARRVLGSRHPEVEDVTQEAAVELVRALPRFRGDCSVMHFGCRMALHVAMAAHRRQAASMRLLAASTEAFDDWSGARPAPGPRASSRAPFARPSAPGSTSRRGRAPRRVPATCCARSRSRRAWTRSAPRRWRRSRTRR